jgi:GNAT superfamily N-acetyltransferase
MQPRTEAAARRGLPDCSYAVTVRTTETDELVGMGRLIGDGGRFCQVVEIAVPPDHQGRGLGTRIGESLLEYLRENVPLSAYATLVSGVGGFSERFGFEDPRPESTGTFARVGDLYGLFESL